MIMVSSVILIPPLEEAAMTIATPRSGFDLEYHLNRTTGEKTGGTPPITRRGPRGLKSAGLGDLTSPPRGVPQAE